MGNLSGALSNLTTSTQHLASLTGLPQEATSIQSATKLKLAMIIKTAKSVQFQITDFATSAKPQLDAIRRSSLAKNNMKQLRMELDAMSERWNEESDQINQKVTQITDSTDFFFQEISSITTVSAKLTSQLAGLNANVQNLQSEIRRTRNVRQASLPPNMHTALSISQGMTIASNFNEQIEHLQEQINSTQREQACVEQFLVNCKILRLDFGQLVTCLLGLKNTLTSLTDDMAKVIECLSDTPDQDTAILMIATAERELAILSQDAA